MYKNYITLSAFETEGAEQQEVVLAVEELIAAVKSILEPQIEWQPDVELEEEDIYDVDEEVESDVPGYETGIVHVNSF